MVGGGRRFESVRGLYDPGFRALLLLDGSTCRPVLAIVDGSPQDHVLAPLAPRDVARPRIDSHAAPREKAGVARLDYDEVVIGRGFDGRLATLRAVEKG